MSNKKTTMITIKLESKRKKKVYHLTHHTKQTSTTSVYTQSITNDPMTRETPVRDEQDNTKVDEAVKIWREREETIARLFSSCPYKVGDRVLPADPTAKEKFGSCTITGICRSYREYSAGRKGSAVEWPEDNNPKIITIRFDNRTDAYAYVPVNWIGLVFSIEENNIS